MPASSAGVTSMGIHGEMPLPAGDALQVKRASAWDERSGWVGGGLVAMNRDATNAAVRKCEPHLAPDVSDLRDRREERYGGHGGPQRRGMQPGPCDGRRGFPEKSQRFR